MDDDDKLRLRVNQAYVAQNVELSDIIDHLIGHGIVDDEFYHQLNNKYVNPTPKDSMTNLLIELPKKGPNAYQVFYSALSENYQHVQQKLDITDIAMARANFMAAGNGPESSQEVIENFLRSVTSLMRTMNSGLTIMAQERSTTDINTNTGDENSRQSEDDKEAVQPSNLERMDDVTDSGPIEHWPADKLVDDFTDEEIKEFIVRRVSSLAENSEKFDKLLTIAMDYIQLLQQSFEERKRQTMFFAEAVEAMCVEVQHKLSELDGVSQQIARETESVMSWSAAEITSKQEEIVDLIRKVENTEKNVIRAAKLVQPIAAEARRCKESPPKLCALS